MVAYVDLYHLLFITALAIMPVVLFLRPISVAAAGPPVAADH